MSEGAVMPVIERPPGEWAWWQDGDEIVVGWLVFDEGDQDRPVAVVRDIRDAVLLVDVLRGLHAR